MNKKDVADHMSDFLKENGFKRKGNRFFKLEECCLIIIIFEPYSSIRPGFFVYPLYFPFPFAGLFFGSHLCYYKDRSFRDLDRESTEAEFEDWISKLKNILSNDIFLHLEEINSFSKLSKFLDKGYSFVKRYWSVTVKDYYVLRSYTDFIMERKDDMKNDIDMGIYWINKWGLYDNIATEWKNKLEILNEKFDRPPNEKKIFIDGIVENTLFECLGKNWKSLTGNSSIFTVDFSDYKETSVFKRCFKWLIKKPKTRY